MSDETETATGEAEPAIDAKLQKQLLGVGRLMHELSKDPKHRREVLSLLKKADPSVAIPELDVEEAADRRADEKVKPVAEQLKSVLSEFTALKTDLAREKWKQATGLDDEELVEVETLAKEAGITKGETAVAFWRQKEQLGTPRGTRKNRTADEYLGKLGKINPRNAAALKSAAFEQANRVIREIRGNRIAG
jgi:hypothetical protein